jgi:flagellar biosynthesis protein FlhG
MGIEESNKSKYTSFKDYITKLFKAVGKWTYLLI